MRILAKLAHFFYNFMPFCPFLVFFWKFWKNGQKWKKWLKMVKNPQKYFNRAKILTYDAFICFFFQFLFFWQNKPLGTFFWPKNKNLTICWICCSLFVDNIFLKASKFLKFDFIVWNLKLRLIIISKLIP